MLHKFPISPFQISTFQHLHFGLFFLGTFAPFFRAFDNPIAIACLRFFTGCLPDFMWCISVRTSCCAFLPYFRPLDFFRDDFFAAMLSPGDAS